MGYWERVQNAYSGEGIFLVLLGFCLFAYLKFLKKLRPNDDLETQNSNQKDTLSDIELERYARHIVLRELGGQGQAKLNKAKILMIGAGGLGSPILQYLAAAGVGTIGVIDDDLVGLSNLQRQTIFDEDVLGKPKVFAVQDRLKALNPHVDVLPFNRRLDENNGKDLIAQFDLVIDGTDNFKTRSLVNQLCVENQIPLVSGAISQWDGQISVFDTKNDTPCYACVFDKEPDENIAPNCAEGGVLGALPGVIGSAMAVEAIKYLAQTGATLSGRMMIYDALYGEVRMVKITKRPDCAVCSNQKE